MASRRIASKAAPHAGETGLRFGGSVSCGILRSRCHAEPTFCRVGARPVRNLGQLCAISQTAKPHRTVWPHPFPTTPRTGNADLRHQPVLSHHCRAQVARGTRFQQRCVHPHRGL